MIFKGEKSVKNDIFLIASLLVTCVIVCLCFHFFKKSGDTVRVTVDGNPYGKYSLSKDMSIDILTGDNNIHLNRLVIKDGKAYIDNANCPDGICEKHFPISNNGESIICLPHRIIVTVETHNQDGQPDIVA